MDPIDKMDALYTCLRADLKALEDGGYINMDEGYSFRVLLARARRRFTKMVRDPVPEARG